MDKNTEWDGAYVHIHAHILIPQRVSLSMCNHFCVFIVPTALI